METQGRRSGDEGPNGGEPSRPRPMRRALRRSSVEAAWAAHSGEKLAVSWRRGRPGGGRRPRARAGRGQDAAARCLPRAGPCAAPAARTLRPPGDTGLRGQRRDSDSDRRPLGRDRFQRQAPDPGMAVRSRRRNRRGAASRGARSQRLASSSVSPKVPLPRESISEVRAVPTSARVVRAFGSLENRWLSPRRGRARDDGSGRAGPAQRSIASRTDGVT